MDEIISYCGLSCQTCPIYLATRETNKKRKEKIINEIIEQCKELYGLEYKFEDISDCDGCKSESRKLFFVCSYCEIRKCAFEKEIENCGYCNEYACDNLTSLFKTDPTAKVRLDKIRSNII